MEKRYASLRIIGTIYRVVGIIIGGITVIAVLFICGTSLLGGAGNSIYSQSSYGTMGLLGGAFGGLIMSLIALLYGGFLALTMYAIGEGVYLLIALEENTRQTAALLQQKQ